MTTPAAAPAAWVFPGQGSQVVGMGRTLYADLPAVRQLYEEADTALGFALSRLCFDGPESELNQTINAQPALVVTSLAHLVALRARGVPVPAPRFVAGHSLGEYSALLAAGALSLPAAVRLVRARGAAMQAAGDLSPDGSSMAAVLGADDAALAEVCAACDVDLANFNAPGQTVISGSRSGVERAGMLIKERGARRVLPLAVSIASHSRLMQPAAATMRALLAAVDLRPPEVPLVANVTAQPTRDPDEIRRLLVAQLTAPVRWVESIAAMAEVGVTTFWEIGAGKVLGGLIKRIVPSATIEQSETYL
ncbi:MAG TPA: ACP S-malonyltransferase [Chloroflexia bacterium]|nr:ACP S-malonyltransferase [Chloroflexia bacterium]